MAQFTEIDEKIFLPIINGYIIVPDIAYNKRLAIQDGLDAIAGSYLEYVAGRLTFVLPTFERNSGYPSDWFATLRAASS